MIVVIGAPSVRPDPDTGRGVPAGFAARIGLEVAQAGAVVQLAGTVGEDPAGDEVLLALARGGVGHDAVLRDPDRATPLATGDPAPRDASAAAALVAESADEAGAEGRPARARDRAAPDGPALDGADISLCLSYLRDYSVIVVAEPLDTVGMAAAGAAAAFTGAALVVILPPGGDAAGAPAGATVLEAPADDPDDAFAGLVARFALALERGSEAADAFATALAGSGWQSAADG